MNLQRARTQSLDRSDVLGVDDEDLDEDEDSDNNNSDGSAKQGSSSYLPII